MPKTKRQPEVRKPTFARVSYGSHWLNYMSVWLAETTAPGPVVLIFYPGGFRTGAARAKQSTQAASTSHSEAQSVEPLRVKQDILRLLSSGISVVAPAHRQPHTDPAPAQFHDAARAVQFVRSKATEWKVDRDRVAATGASSGACLALWLACHDDMAKPRARDPVARESTRLSCAAVNSAVTSVDPRFIRDLMPGCDEYRRFEQLLDYEGEDLDRLPEAKYRLMEEVSPINHVDAGSAPALLRYDRGLDGPFGIHHASFGKVFKERMDAAGVRCELVAGGKSVAGSQRSSIPAFLKEHLID